MCTQRTALSTPASPATSRTSRSRRRSRRASTVSLQIVEVHTPIRTSLLRPCDGARPERKYARAMTCTRPHRFRSAADPRARPRDEQGGVAAGRAGARARARGRGDRPAGLRGLAAGPGDRRGPRARRWRRSPTGSGSSARTWRATRSAAGSRSTLGASGRARSACAVSPIGFVAGREARVRARAAWRPRASSHARWRRSPPRSRAAASAGRAGAHVAARPWRIPPADAALWIGDVAQAPAYWATAATRRTGAAAAGCPATVAWGEHDRLLPHSRQAPRARRAAARGAAPRAARVRPRADVG